MWLKIFAGPAAALIALAGAAHAGEWDDETALCVEGIAGELGVDAVDAKSKLKAARDRASKRVTVEVTFANGQKATGVCKIKRGELTSVEVK